MPVEDYPQLPAMPQRAGSVAADELAAAVAQVAVAAGRDDTLPMLTGIRLEIEGTRLTLAATDRFRLAVRELDWEPEDAEPVHRGTDPGPHARRGREDAAGSGTVEIALSAGDGMLGLTGGGRRATTRLLDAEFPRFRQLIPAEHTTAREVEVRAAGRGDQARGAGRRPGRAGPAGVRRGRAAAGRRWRRRRQRRGGAALQLDGTPLTIAFNPGYLLDALGALHTERTQLTFTTPNRPALVRPVPPPAAVDEEAPTPRAVRVPAPADAGPPAGLSAEASAAPPDRAGTHPDERVGPGDTPAPTDSGSTAVQLGLIGLGKMGGNMRDRLRAAGHEVVGYDPRPEVSDVDSLAELAAALAAPRVVWVMVPLGRADPHHRRGALRGPRAGRPRHRGRQLPLHRRRPERRAARREGHRLHRLRRVRRHLGQGERLRPDGRRHAASTSSAPCRSSTRCARRARARRASRTPARSARDTSPRWSTTASSTA